MNRTLTIPAVAVPAIQAAKPGDRVWIVMEGRACAAAGGCPYERGWCDPPGGCIDARKATAPPADPVAASAPCGYCDSTRRVIHMRGNSFGPVAMEKPCAECRIELVGPCPKCVGNGMVAHCGRTDNGSDGPCVLAPHNDSPCYGEGDVASDWSPVSWCSCGICSCGSRQAWTEQGPCDYCHGQPTPGSVVLGYGYAIGQPLRIIGGRPDAANWPTSDVIVVLSDELTTAVELWRPTGNPSKSVVATDLTDHLAHYGPSESLVGKWALELEVVT